MPITRSAIDSPSNAGMVMAPFMYRELSEGEYDHMAKCATDVVQWRADERVFIGDAPAGATAGSSLLPGCTCGTGPSPCRNASHTTTSATTAMGTWCARRQAVIPDPQDIKSRRTPPIFAGQSRVASSTCSQQSSTGSSRMATPHLGYRPSTQLGRLSRRDAGRQRGRHDAASLPRCRARRRYFCTFAVSRPFHALTDMAREYEHEMPDLWVEKLRDRQNDHLRKPMIDSYWKTVDIIEDEPYVRMCEEADYVMFYVGHTSGDPLPLAPRYEFLESLRAVGPEAAAARVRRDLSSW